MKTAETTHVKRSTSKIARLVRRLFAGDPASEAAVRFESLEQRIMFNCTYDYYYGYVCSDPVYTSYNGGNYVDGGWYGYTNGPTTAGYSYNDYGVGVYGSLGPYNSSVQVAPSSQLVGNVAVHTDYTGGNWNADDFVNTWAAVGGADGSGQTAWDYAIRFVQSVQSGPSQIQYQDYHSADFYTSGGNSSANNNANMLAMLMLMDAASSGSSGTSTSSTNSAGRSVTPASVASAVNSGSVDDLNAQLPPNSGTIFAAGEKASLNVNGVQVTVSLKGKGIGGIKPVGGGLFDIMLLGTDAKSSLSIATKGGDLRVNDLIVKGDIKSIAAKTTDIAGEVDILGSVRKLTLDDLREGATVTIGGNPSDKGATIKLDEVLDANLTSETPIKSLTVTEWMDENDLYEYITAPSLKKLTATGNKKLDIAGHFDAGLILDGADGSTKVLGSVKIAGSAWYGTWDLRGDAGTIKVGGGTNHWYLFADNVKKFDVGDVLQNSEINVPGKVGGNAMERLV